jgi:cell division protein ZipA
VDDLRLILLLIGAAVITAVYGWSRLQARPRKPASPRRPAKHHSADDLDDADIEQELGRMGRLVMEDDEEPAAEDAESAAEAEPEPEPVAQSGERLLVVSVVAADGGQFSGPALLNAFDNNKLRFGEHEIYHRVIIQSGKECPVFGVANMVKPGSFPVSGMETFTTPGLTLFLQLPGPLDGVEAFDDFAQTAERLAVELGGELRDERRRLLTHQALMQWRQSIVEDHVHRRVAS